MGAALLAAGWALVIMVAVMIVGCASAKREPATGGTCYIGTELVVMGEPVALTDGTGQAVAGWWATDKRGAFFTVQRARLSACLA